MDRTEFAKGMYILLSAYPEREIGQDTMDVYYEFLNHLTPAQLEKAARRHIAKSAWFPKVSELLRAVEDPELTVIDVWQKLIAAAETGQKPMPMDTATRAGLQAVGGWDILSLANYESLRYLFKDFKEAYLGARAQDTASLDYSVPQLEG
jgi:hypothetical protein